MAPSSRRPGSALEQADYPRLHVALEAERGVVASDSGLLNAAERHVGGRGAVVIDPHGTRFEPAGDRRGALYVAAPDRGRESVAGVVGAPDRVLDVAEAQHRQHRTE